MSSRSDEERRNCFRAERKSETSTRTSADATSAKATSADAVPKFHSSVTFPHSFQTLGYTYALRMNNELTL